MKIDLSHLKSNETFHTHIVESIQDKTISSAGPVDLDVHVMKSGNDVIAI